MSREAEARREFREFVEGERKRENQQQYEKYLQTCSKEEIEPVSFDEWLAAIPEEFREIENPELRATIATGNSAFKRLNQIAVERLVSAELSDAELALLGLGNVERVSLPDAELSIGAIRLAFDMFAAQTPEYDFKTHYQTLADFFYRNRLNPTATALRIVFFDLRDLFLLPEPEPEVEPVPETKRRVSLEPEEDEQTARIKKCNEYRTKPVLTFAGKTYTSADIDALSAEEYAKIAGVARFSGWLEPAGRL
jgi:hypothetical protein